jgi:hypothetical protein
MPKPASYFFRGLLLLLVGVCVDGCGGGVHGCFLLGLLHWPLPLELGGGVYIHAERLLAKAGGSKRKGRGISHPCNEAKPEWKGRSEAEAAQAKRGSLGKPLARARSGAPERT